jgi:hypothetical protein
MEYIHPDAADAASWLDVNTVADFLIYLAAYDHQHFCAHGRMWTRCWECGHFEDYLGDDAMLDDFID